MFCPANFFIDISVGVLFISGLLVLMYFINNVDPLLLKKNRFFVAVAVIVIILFLWLPPIISYMNINDNNAIWYSGQVLNETRYNAHSPWVGYLDAQGVAQKNPIWNAGKYPDYILFSKKDNELNLIVNDIKDPVVKYCKRGVDKTNRSKVFFLLDQDKHRIYNSSSNLGKKCKVISTVVETNINCCYYNVTVSDDMIWYNSNDNASQNGDSVLIIFDKQERYKYNIFKKNPTKDEFEKYKFGVDL